jgi:hypothetical protein
VTPAHRAALWLSVAGMLAGTGALAGCGGRSAVDTGGFSAGDREAAHKALSTLSQTSVWQTALRTTLTESSLPSACVVHIESRKPLTFKLLLTWIPDATTQRTVFGGQPRADVWLRAVIGPEGLRGAYSLRLGNEHSVAALRSHYGDAFRKPVDRCLLLANGTFGLVSSVAGSLPASAVVRTTQQQHARAGVDPDQDPLGSPDVATVVRSLGHHRYQLLVQNTSPTGAINDFVWRPWPGAKVTALTGRSSRFCRMSSGSMSCRLSLAAPTCLCRPGGSVTIDFTATTVDDKPGRKDATRHGFVDNYLWIGSMTIVPYIIPAHVGKNVRQ